MMWLFAALGVLSAVLGYIGLHVRQGIDAGRAFFVGVASMFALAGLAVVSYWAGW